MALRRRQRRVANRPPGPEWRSLPVGVCAAPRCRALPERHSWACWPSIRLAELSDYSHIVGWRFCHRFGQGITCSLWLGDPWCCEARGARRTPTAAHGGRSSRASRRWTPPGAALGGQSSERGKPHTHRCTRGCGGTLLTRRGDPPHIVGGNCRGVARNCWGYFVGEWYRLVGGICPLL